MNVHAKDIARLMGGKKTLGREVRDFADLDAVVEAGLPKGAAAQVRKALEAGPGLPKGKVGQALRVEHPSKEQSRLIERTARLAASAELAFGSWQTGLEFLSAPHDRLGGKRPIDCVETELGLKQVEQEIDAIVFGLPA